MKLNMTITHLIAFEKEDLKIEQDIFKIIKNTKKNPSLIDKVLVNPQYRFSELIKNYKKSYYQFIFEKSLLHHRDDIVNYLLTSNVHKESMTQNMLDVTLLKCCLIGNKVAVKKMVDYGADIHFRSDYIFSILYNTAQHDMVNFLIFELNLKKTKTIKEQYCDYIEELEQMFEIRQLRKDLEDNLQHNNKIIIKNKL